MAFGFVASSIWEAKVSLVEVVSAVERHCIADVVCLDVLWR